MECLIKNAEALEKMDKVDTLIVDKTGTITEGKPTVEKVGAFGTNFSEKEVLQYIVSLNSMSEHPLAEATVKYGKEQKYRIFRQLKISVQLPVKVLKEPSTGKKWYLVM